MKTALICPRWPRKALLLVDWKTIYVRRCSLICRIDARANLSLVDEGEVNARAILSLVNDGESGSRVIILPLFSRARNWDLSGVNGEFSLRFFNVVSPRDSWTTMEQLNSAQV